MYFVYMLRCSGNALYTGVTSDMQRRLKEHSSGTGAKFTRSRKVEGIAALWKVEDHTAALKTEYAIKQLSKQKKEALAASPELLEEMTGFPGCPVPAQQEAEG